MKKHPAPSRFHSIFLLILLLCQSAFADNLPTGFRPVSGNLSIGQTGNTLTVTAASNSSIAEWGTFNIGSGYSVNMWLPGANSAILNRVVGGSPSNIFGNLNSNGRVFLINNAGILFGPTAKINVGSLMASTLNLSNANFLTGNYLFQQLGAAASIVNEGEIKAAPGGTVNLFAGAIDNKGTITAPGGQVNLAVGKEIVFANRGGIGFGVYVDQKLLDKVAGFQDAISNSGSIKANGGLVKLAADFERGLYNYAINSSGTVLADKALNIDGHIQFISSGDILNSGTVKSSSSTYIETNTLQNDGKIEARTNLNIIANGLKTIIRQNPDGTLIHSPDGSVDSPLQNRPLETISFSILNNPNASLKAGIDLSIVAKNVFNTSGSIEAGQDLLISADNLTNERAGF